MKIRSLILAGAAALWAAQAVVTQAGAEVLRMAVTTSFSNSGLAEILLPKILEDTGIEVQLLIVGTGQALKLGEQGDVDAVLVHARAAEDAFVAAGFGAHRREIMYNDFIVIGPTADPAGVKAATAATEALAGIAGARADFVSRGDDSGTHKKELELWAAAGVTLEGDWYKAVGQGMGAALNTAAGLNAYILSDRASWLNFGNKADLAMLFDGDPALFNQYTYIPVNPEKQPHVNKTGAEALEAWLTGDTAKSLIDGYTLEGQQLFHFNARPI